MVGLAVLANPRVAGWDGLALQPGLRVEPGLKCNISLNALWQLIHSNFRSVYIIICFVDIAKVFFKTC